MGDVLDYLTERCRHGAHEGTGYEYDGRRLGECLGYVIDQEHKRWSCPCECHKAV